MATKVLFLTNGACIMGFFEELENGIKLKKTVEVVIKQNEDADFFVSFIPFLHYTNEYEEGIYFSSDRIISVATPIKQVEDHYLNCINYKPNE